MILRYFLCLILLLGGQSDGMALDGIALIAPNANASISGKVVDIKGQPLTDVLVVLSDEEDVVIDATQVDAAGQYRFENLPTDVRYGIRLIKNDQWLNELSQRDIRILSQISLGIDSMTLNTPLNLSTGDVDQSGLISAFDLVRLARILIFEEEGNDLGPAWNFQYAYGSTFLGEKNPTGFNGTKIQLDGDVISLDFVGIKMGNLYQAKQ